VTTLTAPLSTVEAPERGELTLGELLTGAWHELHGHGSAACPACGERMTLAGDAGSCSGCGSELR
jgi:hypothetical protein